MPKQWAVIFDDLTAHMVRVQRDGEFDGRDDVIVDPVLVYVGDTPQEFWKKGKDKEVLPMTPEERAVRAKLIDSVNTSHEKLHAYSREHQSGENVVTYFNKQIEELKAMHQKDFEEVSEIIRKETAVLKNSMFDQSQSINKLASYTFAKQKRLGLFLCILSGCVFALTVASLWKWFH